MAVPTKGQGVTQLRQIAYLRLTAAQADIAKTLDPSRDQKYTVHRGLLSQALVRYQIAVRRFTPSFKI
jgi:hypothetical protein